MGEVEATPEPPVRIVVADDHPVVRAGMRALLDGEPDLEVVADGPDAATADRLVRGHKPDVLVIDMVMPGESGLDAIPRLREAAPDTCIVVLTMRKDPALARRAIQAGASAYVLKESATNELVLAVRRAARGEQYLSPQLGALLAVEPEQARPRDLSARELEVLRLVALGHTNPEIAERLYISPRTVEAHRSRINHKLGMTTRADVVRFALDHGLIER
jgi:two-component system, NarL family, response regulator NreC